MGTRNEPGIYDCHEHAKDDEPRFTLLARDPAAAELVRAWADNREENIALGRRPASDAEKVEEARRLADAMDAWRKRYWPARLDAPVFF